MLLAEAPGMLLLLRETWSSGGAGQLAYLRLERGRQREAEGAARYAPRRNATRWAAESVSDESHVGRDGRRDRRDGSAGQRVSKRRLGQRTYPRMRRSGGSVWQDYTTTFWAPDGLGWSP